MILNSKDIPYEKRLMFFGIHSEEAYDAALDFIKKCGRETFQNQHLFGQFVKDFVRSDSCYLYDYLHVEEDTGMLVSVPFCYGFCNLRYVDNSTENTIDDEHKVWPDYIEREPFLVIDVAGNIIFGDKPYRAVFKDILHNKREISDRTARRRLFYRTVLSLIQKHYNELHGTGYIPTDVEEMVF